MALPENLLLKVNIDPLRADPDIISEHEDNPLSILTDEQDSKLVDIATLRKYDRVLRGTELGETFDTLKEIQTNIETEVQRAKEEEEKLYLETQTEIQRSTEVDKVHTEAIAAETARAIAEENKLNNAINDLNAWKTSHEAGHANKQETITAEISQAKQAAIAETLASIQIVNNTEIDALFNQGGAGE